MKAVVTVVGRDTVGILAKIAGVCAETNVNVEEVTQSILSDLCHDHGGGRHRLHH